MSDPQDFTIEIGSGRIRGNVHAPASPRAGAGPALLLCRSFPGASADDPEGLRADLVGGLLDAGFIVVDYVGREGDPGALTDANTVVEDVVTVFRWMLELDAVDAERTGVLGLGAGAVAAAGLAARTDRVARLGLVGAVTAEDLVARLGRDESTALMAPVEVGETFAASLVELHITEEIRLHERATLILHGAADLEVPRTCPLAYLHALENAGRPVRMEFVARAGHAFADPPARESARARVLEFFSALTRRSAA